MLLKHVRLVPAQACGTDHKLGGAGLVASNGLRQQLAQDAVRYALDPGAEQWTCALHF